MAMKTIKELVKAILNGDGQLYEETGDVISLGTRGDNCYMSVKILCDDENQMMSVLAGVELIVPPDRKAAVLAVINDLNAKNMFGSFSLSLENRRVSCCCSCYSNAGALNGEVATAMIASVVSMLDEAYLPLMRARLGVQPEQVATDSGNDEADE